MSHSAITKTGREETQLIFPGILATFRYLSFTTEEKLILQTTKESALKTVKAEHYLWTLS